MFFIWLESNLYQLICSHLTVEGLCLVIYFKQIFAQDFVNYINIPWNDNVYQFGIIIFLEFLYISTL